jgi:hypothetical protein
MTAERAVICPFTSRALTGALVLIPTLPPVVKMLPIVLLVPTAERFVLTRTTPADTFVSTRFVDVMLTTVRVPATSKFPDKLIFPPVIVVAEIRVEESVLIVPDVANKTPVVTPVALSVPAVTLVATTDPELIILLTILVMLPDVANKTPVVTPVALTVPAVTLVATTDPELIILLTILVMVLDVMIELVFRRVPIVAVFTLILFNAIDPAVIDPEMTALPATFRFC